MPGVKTNEIPGTRAVLRHYRMSAYKARQVLDLVRGKDVDRAAEILEATPREGARVVAKVLASAVANARNNDFLDPDDLYVSACYAGRSRRVAASRRSSGASAEESTSKASTSKDKTPATEPVDADAEAFDEVEAVEVEDAEVTEGQDTVSEADETSDDAESGEETEADTEMEDAEAVAADAEEKD